jgi:hypothetical protein
MSRSIVAAVKSIRVPAEHEPHPVAEVWLGCLEDGVDVRIHHAVGVTPPAVALDDLLEPVDEHPPVEVVEDDMRPAVALGNGVMDCARGLAAMVSRHFVSVLYVVVQDNWLVKPRPVASG